ncbi:MAG TPA: GNAT family protein [Acidimicrobiales bacterium]|nr:GNAT family protein [Acidimicrobiales bacterium]
MAEDATWLDQRPPEQLDAGDFHLARVTPDDAPALISAVNASLSQLRPWMPWAQDPATPESIGTFLRGADPQWDGFQEFQFVIRETPLGPVIGSCGLHTRLGVGALEIGYWVHVDHIGRGVATAAAGALTVAAFRLRPVRRVEIHCDAANLRSAAVPAKLGYRLDRTEPRPPTTPGETRDQMVWVCQRATGTSTNPTATERP